MTFSPGRGPGVINFQRAMVFIDGTNTFHRLEGAKRRLKKDGLYSLCEHYAKGRQIVRAYLYTTVPHFEKAQAVHGMDFADRVRVVYGHPVPDGKGNVKEKGVDALLVADMVYHAAVKNYDYALLISVDTDFAHPLRRVEDFGCRTGVVGICCEVPDRLGQAADDTYLAHKDENFNKWTEPA
ncbi:MAG: NYN domain-containing protein [Pyrinomonadaceae bacterium]